MRLIPTFPKPSKEFFYTVLPVLALILVAGIVLYRFVDPAPPRKIVIATGNGEGDYLNFAKLYRDAIRAEGVELDIRKTTGAVQNLNLIVDPNSDVDVGFVQDGLDTNPPAENVMSLGSLYYIPLWVFYRGTTEMTRFTQFKGKRVAIGQRGGGTPAITASILAASGVAENEMTVLRIDFRASAAALKKGETDIAIFLAPPEEAVIKDLIAAKGVRLMSVDQAEAITRHIPYLHHLVLPHGALNLKNNLPETDVHLLSTTATLLAKDTFHPALVDLLLRAASEIHDEPGIFERKNEFPMDKDYNFPMSEEAKRYFKSGSPLWRRYLPFWLANLVERFIFVLLPLLVVVIPLLKSIPAYLQKRVRAKIYRSYGELKYLETQILAETDRAKYPKHLEELDEIEMRVNRMNIPVDHSDHLYGLREHIDFVRQKLNARN